MARIILRVIAFFIVCIWGLLTMIVLYFLHDRWQNPGRKGISNLDLIDYGKISGLLFLAVLLIGISFMKDVRK